VIHFTEDSITFYEQSTVTFDVLSDAEIEAYVKTNDWTDKAGGYGIQCKWNKLSFYTTSLF